MSTSTWCWTATRAACKAFFAKHGKAELTDVDTVTALALLEMQRHAMLMYTSCGWFFDELSGIETVQTIMYAGRALQLGADAVSRPSRRKVQGAAGAGEEQSCRERRRRTHLREVGETGGGEPAGGGGPLRHRVHVSSAWERAAPSTVTRCASAKTFAWSRDARGWPWAPRRFARALPTSSRRSASACCTSAITT